MKIGLAGLMHETVTTLPGFTELIDFERNCKRREEILTFQKTNTLIGGFLEALFQEKIAIEPILFADAGVGPRVRDHIFFQYQEEICVEIKKTMPALDGILLALHGSMVTESLQDPELYFLRRIREVTGYQFPIFVAFDLHGNIQKEILEEASVITAYHESPHVDKWATGKRTALLLLDTLQGKICPTQALVKPGLVVPSVFSATSVGAAAKIVKRAREWERDSRVIDISVFFGFPFSDVHCIGLSVVATTDNARDLAEEAAQDVSALAFHYRHELNGQGLLHSVKEGVALAIQQAKTATKPIVILDHADRCSNSTFVLKELLKQKAKGVAIPLFYEPEVAETCLDLPVGNQVELIVGGKTHLEGGDSVCIKGNLLYQGIKEYIGTGPMRIGQRIDLGPTAIVDTGNLWIQFVSYRKSLIDEDPFIQFGYSPQEFSIILSKSKTHFRAVYEDLADSIIIVDVPGCGTANLKTLKYHNVPPGVYPITLSEGM